jgi:transposase
MRKLRPSHSEPIRKLIADAASMSDEQRFLHRLHCVLLVSVGRSCYEVAAWFGENPRTIERWVHAHEEDCVSGLQDHHGAGRPARLSFEQARNVTRELGQSPVAFAYEEGTWNGKLLAKHLETRYGVHLSVRQCQRMLRALRRVPAAAIQGDAASVLTPKGERAGDGVQMKRDADSCKES